MRVPGLPLREFPLFFLPPPLFCFPLPLGNLVRGPGQVRRHLPGSGLARERRDARREVFKGRVSFAPFPRPPFRLQRRSRPVELQRAAELAERFSELRPRPRDTVEMHPVAALVLLQLHALVQRSLRPPRPGGVTGKGSHRRPGCRRFRQLRPPDRLRPAVSRRRRIAQHLLHRPAVDAEPPARLVMAQTLVDNRQSNRRIELHAVHLLPLVATDKGP